MYAPDIIINLLSIFPYIITLPSVDILYAIGSPFSCVAIPIEVTMGRNPIGIFAIICPDFTETADV